jgi:hypothetical protein
LLLILPNLLSAQINKKAPAITIDSVFINAPIGKVWVALTEINQWNQRYDFIVNSQAEEPLQVEKTFRWQTNKLKIKSKLLVVDTQKQLCWKGGKYGVLVYHNWVFQSISPTKTLLISEESQQGIVVSLFREKFRKSLKSGSIKWLNQINNYCEK